MSQGRELWWIMMTTTGYINMLFTKINSARTTTVITLLYNSDYDFANTYFIGP